MFGMGDMRCDGAWAERVAVDHRIVAAIPNAVSFTAAFSLPVEAITAWEVMFRDAGAADQRQASWSSAARAGSARSLSRS